MLFVAVNSLSRMRIVFLPSSLTAVRCGAGCGAMVRPLTRGPPVLAGSQDGSGGALLPRTTAGGAGTPPGPAGPLAVHCRRTGQEAAMNVLCLTAAAGPHRPSVCPN